MNKNPFRVIIDVRGKYPRLIAALLEGKRVVLKAYPDGSGCNGLMVDPHDHNEDMAIPDDDNEEYALGELVYVLHELRGMTQSKRSTVAREIYWITPFGKYLLLSDQTAAAERFDDFFAAYHALKKTADLAYEGGQKLFKEYLDRMRQEQDPA